MVNITKEIFNALWTSFFVHCQEGADWDEIFQLIHDKYGKYIDETFDIIEFEKKLKKKKEK